MAAITTTSITGYPNFNSLPGPAGLATAYQLQLLWDAVHKLSADLAIVAAAVNSLDSRVTATESRLTTGGL